ncbi:MAG TPA: LLM class F420-dependent oxidoreductase [Chloroflexi bacterium]|nr:LLM class F420-dependent oxidoreductase [Chloroflexota bacterium]HHW87596.1 LLM class F420-dependent oxidoreductase [Chloroflexota bacterium]
MRLGLMVGYSGSTITLPMAMIKEADRLGYYAVWTAEAYGSDAVAPLAWIGAQTERIKLGTAIMQMPARTPASTAMTAMTLDQLSGGRMLLGLGLSGPQVVEGWHGVAYGKPLGKTREYVSIVRAIFAREAPLVHDGEHYQIPYKGADATGLGKPLKSILHGRRDLPIYLAAIGPKNVELAAEIADGWLPIIFSPAHYAETYQTQVEAGFAKAGGGKSLATFDIAPSVPVVLGDDVDACRASIKPFLALYIGGMGARGKNFYHELACRYGFQTAADRVQDLYLAGQKDEAARAIPDALVDATALCGPKTRIAEQLEMWQASPITTLNMTTFDLAAVRVMAELVMGADAGHPDRTISIPPTTTQPPAPSPEATPAALFARMAKRIAENPDLASKIGASFQFNLTGDQGGDWLVNLKGAADVRSGVLPDADCTIAMSDLDFVALATGKLNPMTAFSTGKLRLQGNPMTAMKLQSLFS